jgi:hypothetical protein
VPRKNLAAPLRRDEPAAPGGKRPAEADWPKPSPEEIREMLSGYQSGFDRGLTDRGLLDHTDVDHTDVDHTDVDRTDLDRTDVDHGSVNRMDVDHEHTVADRILGYPTNTPRRTGRGKS